MPATDQMLVHFSENLPALYRIITSTAFFIGLVLITRATFKLKVYGEMRSMMSPHAKMSQILILYGVGAALMYLSSTIPLFLSAVFASPQLTPLTYAGSLSINFDEHVIMASKALIQVIGLISFVRGLLQLTGVQEGGGRTTFGKAIVHILAGIFAVNIQQTINLLEFSFGM